MSEMPERIVGIDPGKTTGLSYWRGGTYQSGREIPGLTELLMALVQHQPDLLVIEDFLGGYAHVNFKDPLRVIGACEMWAEERDCRVVFQSPGILRTRLRLAEGLHPSKHVRCSAAHVIHYLRRAGHSVG